ncbi:hypothetical protein QVD17_07133 [Tagetes erecta]|uniref:Histone-lysine N-methyltransferase ATXR5 n=1 Tax=Tagetes erecta TaxID=13708 RepID=A0AAD8PCP2_TARER|nr:hypothetical protein QVD17_07133 [Tagetes erecta]
MPMDTKSQICTVDGVQEPLPPKRFRSMREIMKVAEQVVIRDDDYYNQVMCVECGSGDRDEQLLLCDKCDRGYHMVCVKPIVVRVPMGHWYCPNCADYRPRVQSMQRKRRTSTLVYRKKNRRLLPYNPSKDIDQRLQQMTSLASALTSLNLAFSNDLTYPPGMAPESANRADLENGKMQVLSKRDMETYKQCRAMAKRGEYPPLLVVFDHYQGYTVEANGAIKDMTLIAEYTGDVDYIKNREKDDSDSMMTLLLATDQDKSLVICPDKRGNISRFISGINNHKPECRKKINVKCLRFNVEGACRILLVATRDIKKGERLYYDYNGYEHKYPTQFFV